MSLTIIRQDITKLEVDAIVNAINSEFLVDGGVCETIFEKAGKEKLLKACKVLPPLKTSQAVITDGFELCAKNIIHTIGPVFNEDVPKQSKELLRQTYVNCLYLAKENKLESIAFPLISSGAYGFPKEQALKIAREVITNFLNENELEVILTIFDEESFIISKNLLLEVESYIDENYVTQNTRKRPSIKRSIYVEEVHEICEEPKLLRESSCLEEVLENLDESFSTSLLKLIDEKGKTDVEVYKKANIDRKLFSKIRTQKGYTPSKKTIVALSISLELSLDETNELLSRAGLTLSHSQKFDVIIEYFLVNKKYDIYEINEVLFKYDQVLLGS